MPSLPPGGAIARTGEGSRAETGISPPSGFLHSERVASLSGLRWRIEGRRDAEVSLPDLAWTGVEREQDPRRRRPAGGVASEPKIVLAAVLTVALGAAVAVASSVAGHAQAQLGQLLGG